VIDLSTLRSRLILIAVAVLALAGAFSAGRFSGPAKVETRDVEHVVYKNKIVEKIVTVKEAAKVVTVWRDRVTSPDGTVTDHTIEKSATDSKVSVTDNTARSATLDDKRDTSTVVTNLPRWRISLGVGGSLVQPLVPISGPLVIVTSAEYRIIGGLSAGIWLNTVGAAGVLVSFSF